MHVIISDLIYVRDERQERAENVGALLCYTERMTVTATRKTLTIIQPGRLEYQAAWDWQQHLVAERSAGARGDMLLLLEHPATITLGRKARREHILLGDDELARQGVAVVACDRGGDVTYHAPGQVVGYPILKLSRHGGDLGRYMRNLEEVIIRTLADYGLRGERAAGLTGVWIEQPAGLLKVCAIGVKLSAGGVTSHGFALNVDPEMAGFSRIVPCGISDRGVTSLEQLLAAAPVRADVEARMLAHFAEVFDVETVWEAAASHARKEIDHG
jgi:lipoyl(octanoyl) transferase